MKTTLYLIGHADMAEADSLARPHAGAPLARLGVRQAELTRDFLAVRPIDYGYCSPATAAVRTAAIIVAPHGLFPVPVASLVDEPQVTDTLEELFSRHAGHALLVVVHHDVARAYLAGLLGMNPERAGQVQLDNCGISVVLRAGPFTTVSTLNASFHLQGLAA